MHRGITSFRIIAFYYFGMAQRKVLHQYEDLYIENTAARNCMAKDPQDLARELLDKTVAVAEEVVGEEREIDQLYVVSQTGHLVYDNSLAEEVRRRIEEVGIIVNGAAIDCRAFSNSQPIFGEAGKDADENRKRTLVIAAEPQDFWKGVERSAKIADGVLEPGATMLDGLDRLTSAHQRYLKISNEELRARLKKLAIYMHQQKLKNPLRVKDTFVDEDEYDGPNNRKVGEKLRLYDCCMPASRTSATLLTHDSRLKNDRNAVRVIGHSTVEDPRPKAERFRMENYPKNEALYSATNLLLNASVAREKELTRERLKSNGVLEVHNAVNSLLPMELEEMGFPFEDSILARTNRSGGLVTGHPLSATYPSVLHSARKQLLGQAGEGVQLEGADSALIQSIWGLRDWMSVTGIIRS